MSCDVMRYTAQKSKDCKKAIKDIIFDECMKGRFIFRIHLNIIIIIND